VIPHTKYTGLRQNYFNVYAKAGASSGDPPIVGVARPVDPSDPNLTRWVKDPANPIQVSGAVLRYLYFNCVGVSTGCSPL
jgi:hypothetical protein